MFTIPWGNVSLDEKIPQVMSLIVHALQTLYIDEDVLTLERLRRKDNFIKTFEDNICK